MVSDRRGTPDVDFLRLFALSPDPVLTAGELADELPVTQQAVNSRLKRMEKDGLVESKKVGAAARVYWLTEHGKQTLAEELSIWRQSSADPGSQ